MEPHGREEGPRALFPLEARGSAMGGEEPGTSGRHPMYLVVHNQNKKQNIGTLARCATAFGVEEVILVGSNKYSTHGSHGASDHVAFRHFATLEACKEWLRERGAELIGVEIVEGAENVASHPFRGPTAFMLGNEGAGMNEKQLAACDRCPPPPGAGGARAPRRRSPGRYLCPPTSPRRFVYIPQHGAGTASLNVAVAGSLVLHHFALWAGYGEREREGYKFVVAERPQRTHRRGTVPLSEEQRAALSAERARRGEGAESGDDGGNGVALFDD